MDGDPSIIEPWNSDSDDVHLGKTKDNIAIESEHADRTKGHRSNATPNTRKGKLTLIIAFYHEPFIFRETYINVRDSVASLFTKRIRDYDMPNGMKVPTNIRTYDGMTNSDDHLTVFMGTMDIHKLQEPDFISRYVELPDSGTKTSHRESLIVFSN